MGLEFGTTQHALLRLLLHNKPGLTVDALTQSLRVSRNAVRQHLAALERDGAVTRGPTQPTGGRPEQIYRITQNGQERFPRQYSWFSELLIEMMQTQLGAEGAAEKLAQMGRNVGEKVRAEFSGSEDARIAALAETMAEIGYEASAKPGATEIEAQNCVFHQLAAKHPQVCRFDLGLLAAASGKSVEHSACMVRGDAKCCFRFHDEAGEREKTSGPHKP